MNSPFSKAVQEVPQTPVKLGISACLLGQNVRYDGGHKLDRYLRDVLGPRVQWVPVCPEVECGLSVPREAMHLVGDAAAPRLVTLRSGIDHTERMLKWAERRLDELDKESLCGFIFKIRSPSSGMRDIKLYDEKGRFSGKKGVGLFAGLFMKRFPLIPVEDEGRLNDAGIRENFIERIFTVNRWKEKERRGWTVRDLIEFHTENKLLIMAHSPALLRDLGRLTAHAGPENLPSALENYFSTLLKALGYQATVKKNVNVLQHVMGYFKKQLTADEKRELLEIIGLYHRSLIPLVVPVTMLNHYARKYREPYLSLQTWLNPHPAELMLRNHV
ncbi:MAG TPA: DUF1722 domain-containing protein [bacterium]|nr:DUF1722 domain-containing protein [bacterium]